MSKKLAPYSEELALEICEQIGSSSKGLNTLCKENAHWPDRATIYRWLIRYKPFCDMYARARIAQIDPFVDDVIEIADDTSLDHRVNEDGSVVVDHEHINRSRLKIDTRKWLASKLCPKVYGDKVQSDVNVTMKQEDALKELE